MTKPRLINKISDFDLYTIGISDENQWICSGSRMGKPGEPGGYKTKFFTIWFLEFCIWKDGHVVGAKCWINWRYRKDHDSDYH